MIRNALAAAALLAACAPVVPPAPLAPLAPLGPQEVSVDTPVGTLAGTLIEMGPRSPAVLLLPGSGPTDRDGNNRLGVTGGVYRQLAEGLQRHGITSLRIDKRGIGGSAAVTNPSAVTIADYAGDAVRWADLLTARGHRCVWLAGHSEGGLIALAAAAQLPSTCGVVLIAAPGRKMDVILREQLKAALPPEMFAVAEPAVAELAAGRRVDASRLPAGLQPIFNPATQGFLIDMMRQDPAAEIAALKVPVLIVQGSEDIQVKPADAAALSAAQPRATLVTVDGMNHVLRLVPKGDRAANLKSYAAADQPIAPSLVEAIASFVNGAR